LEILIVRHGESEGNLDGRLQGHLDSPLTERGRAQAAQVGGFLGSLGLRWEAAYASPLARARETARIIADRTGYPEAVLDEDLREIGAGQMEGLTRDDMERRFPDFLKRAITNLGDFAEYGGESYEDVQRRVARFMGKMMARHREAAERVLVVAHGGLNFQLVKNAICVPVPRVCLLHWGNCTATLLRYRERRGVYMADIVWHVPLELMGGGSGEGTTAIFR
jgi:broad specificity phosphatase PhoE